MRVPSVALTLFALAAGTTAAQGQMVSFNEFATLTNKAFGASSIGWYFTPTSSFFVTSISTRFNGAVAAADRDVTVELWSDRQAVGGSLLRSGVFSSGSATDQFGGGFFDALWLEEGVTYFIGFRNVAGLGRNSTEDAGSASSGYLYYSLGDPNLGNYATLQNVTMLYNPSFQLDGYVDPAFAAMPTTATPEPASMVLMATGMLGLGVVTAVRRRRAQKEAATEPPVE